MTLTAKAYAAALSFRYSVGHFECSLDEDCDHVYHATGNSLPAVKDVSDHIAQQHSHPPTLEELRASKEQV